MAFVIGVDTGGTFTDVIVIDQNGDRTSGKAPTTPHDLAQGVMDATESAANELGMTRVELLAQTSVFRFSGTTVTNALITRGGVSTGMLTTSGFEDTLHIGRAMSGWAGSTEEETRFAFRQTKPAPLVPKHLIRGVVERTDWSGAEVVPLDEAGVRASVAELVDAGVQSIAVCFLWAVQNGAHEDRVAELIRGSHPDISVHCSHKIASSLGEYERFVTTAIDAYVGPVMERFLERLQQLLGESGFAGQLVVAQGSGGGMYADEIRPVYTLHSGPAAGVIASKDEAELIGYENVITTDVGGTSFDVGMVADGEWIYSREPVSDQFNLALPLIEVDAIGAGGGSIAWVDATGVMHVGPASAGAVPGPVCYGRGGTRPTVTDVDLMLGYLDPDYFLGGKVRLDREAAEAAIAELGDELGMSAIETAAGIFQIANSHMADLLRRRVVARGYDPRDFVVYAYGGAGGIHCAFYGEDSGVREVVVPELAGTFSALGVTTAPLLHTARRLEFAPMPMSGEQFNAMFAPLEDEVVSRLERDGVPEDKREIVYALEMRYGIQVHTVRLTLSPMTYTDEDVADVCDLFDATYERLYGTGSGYSDAGRFMVACVVDGFGSMRPPARGELDDAGEDASAALMGTRQAYFNGEFVETNIYRHDQLQTGNVIQAPAVVEAKQATIVVPPDRRAWMDEYSNIRIVTGGNGAE
jgi:N-methylhydantoinase A